MLGKGFFETRQATKRQSYFRSKNKLKYQFRQCQWINKQNLLILLFAEFTNVTSKNYLCIEINGILAKTANISVNLIQIWLFLQRKILT